jgi:hypothetical protein
MQGAQIGCDNRDDLIRLNPSFSWISDAELLSEGLGRLVQGPDVSAVMNYLKNEVTLPEQVAYVASDSRLEVETSVAWIGNFVFGEMPIQTGYCVGHSRRLNALEYHLGSEVIVAATSMVLLLDRAHRIVNAQYDPRTLKAFYLAEGSVLELFSHTLHFAPLETSGGGFRAGIILPRGTNLPLELAEGADRGLLFAKNKWLVAHPDSPSAKRGAHTGIVGPNLQLLVP